jgi:hypothetical protein
MNMKSVLVLAALLLSGQAFAIDLLQSGKWLTGLSYADVTADVDGKDYGDYSTGIVFGKAFVLAEAVDMTIEASYAESDSIETTGSADYSYSYNTCQYSRGRDCGQVDVPLAYDWNSQTETEAWSIGLTAGKFIGNTGLRPYILAGYAKNRVEITNNVNLNGSPDTDQSYVASQRDSGLTYGAGIEYVKRAIFVRASYEVSQLDAFGNLDDDSESTKLTAGIRF